MPDGTSRFSIGNEKIHHYMGCSTFSNFTVLPEIAVAKIREDAPFDKVCYIGCGVTTGVGAVINTAKVEPGAKCIVFGLGGIGLNVIQGLRLVGADMIIGVDLNPEKKAWGERFGMTHFVNPKEVGGDLVAHLVNMTKSGADQIGGADYTFECVGSVNLMRMALESCHRGWGQSIIIGVAGSGQEIATRPFQLVTGRVWRGTAFGGARGRTDVPKIVDWYMQGKIEIDPMITHTMPLDRHQQGVRPDARRQEHPQRRRVLIAAKEAAKTDLSDTPISKRRSPTFSASSSRMFRRSASRPSSPRARSSRPFPDILHGGAIMALADNLGGVATVANLPKGARTATIESKTNFFAADPGRRNGARRVHGAASRPHHHGLADQDHPQ